MYPIELIKINIFTKIGTQNAIKYFNLLNFKSIILLNRPKLCKYKECIKLL